MHWVCVKFYEKQVLYITHRGDEMILRKRSFYAIYFEYAFDYAFRLHIKHVGVFSYYK